MPRWQVVKGSIPFIRVHATVAVAGGFFALFLILWVGAPLVEWPRGGMVGFFGALTAFSIFLGHGYVWIDPFRASAGHFTGALPVSAREVFALGLFQAFVYSSILFIMGSLCCLLRVDPLGHLQLLLFWLCMNAVGLVVAGIARPIHSAFPEFQPGITVLLGIAIYAVALSYIHRISSPLLEGAGFDETSLRSFASLTYLCGLLVIGGGGVLLTMLCYASGLALLKVRIPRQHPTR